MATTAVGNPYVESSDLVANYPGVSETLAERIDVVGVNPFADAAARTTAIPSPTEGQMSSLADTDSVERYDGTAWVAVGPGKILQVVYASYSTEVSSSSTTFADTGLTATITPSSATSKVLVMFSQNGGYSSHLDIQNGIELVLYRDATQIFVAATLVGYTGDASKMGVATISGTPLDSPATTSAVTYKTMFANRNASSVVNVQSEGCVSTITLMEVAA